MSSNSPSKHYSPKTPVHPSCRPLLPASHLQPFSVHPEVRGCAFWSFCCSHSKSFSDFYRNPVVTGPCLGSSLAGEAAPSLPLPGRDLDVALTMIWDDWNLGVEGMTAREWERRGGYHVALPAAPTGRPEPASPGILAPRCRLPCPHRMLGSVVGTELPTGLFLPRGFALRQGAVSGFLSGVLIFI